MIVIDVTDTAFMDLPAWQADEWMIDNVGPIISDTLSNVVGVGWRLYKDDGNHYDRGKWLMAFESDERASWFILKWT